MGKLGQIVYVIRVDSDMTSFDASINFNSNSYQLWRTQLGPDNVLYAL